MMKKIEGIEELHTILLDMAKSFHQICEEEKIPYYMLGGTLLGAVRHKGFIPWDDDMDFGVPREYFDSLIKALTLKLPSHYGVYDKTSGITDAGFIKICDKRTVRTHYWDPNPNKQFGINIDIFPIDKLTHLWKRKIVTFLMRLHGYKVFDAKERPGGKRMVAYMVKALLCCFKRSMFVDFIEEHLIETKGELLTNTFGAYNWKRETMPESFFGTPQLLDFEDTKLYAVAKPHEYLEHMFGDYMKLPSEEKRRIHIKDMYWIV